LTPSEKYYTLKENASAEIMEKGSRFIAFIFPVESEKEAKNYINNIKTIHPKARHWCYAWRFGTEGKMHKASDDGEPRGTAGKPILNQIDSFNLTNVLLVVVRYFGGTLLGTSGLIKAYKEVSRKCITQAELILYREMRKYTIQSTNTKIQILLSILKELNVRIINYSLEGNAEILFEIPFDDEEVCFRKIKSKMEKQPSNQVEEPMQLKDCKLIYET
jgi:uncharacterized YigZ family protein